jgi:hypothetical protein
MKDEGVEPVELAERFFLWLDHVGSAAGIWWNLTFLTDIDAVHQ